MINSLSIVPDSLSRRGVFMYQEDLDMAKQSQRNIVEEITQFNQGRDEGLLKLKYQAMRANPFSFFRGSCHLFYQDWPECGPLNDAPLAWICGDLHLENFGSFKGDNRLVYFDLNDFDEAVLAPCTWEIARFLTSVFLAADNLSYSQSEAFILAKSALDSFTQALCNGHVYSVETQTAQGLVKELLVSLQQRKRKDFLDNRTELVNKQRRLKLDPKRNFALGESKFEKLKRLIDDLGSKSKNSDFFKVLDIAGRIGGNSSLGLERYVILVEGKGSPDKNYLLDLKAQTGSALAKYLKVTQPNWSSQAQRTSTIQKNMQSTSPAILLTVEDGEQSFLLKELQPKEDKVNLKQLKQEINNFEQLLKTMANLAAWSQLRAAGRAGSDIPDRLIEFACQKYWPGEILTYSQNYSLQVKQDYQDFYDSDVLLQ